MADVHYWIQMENRPWDTSPCIRNVVDRMTNASIAEAAGFPGVTVTVPASPATGSVPRPDVVLHNPVRHAAVPAPGVFEALILRRYKPPVQADESDAWTVPDDRKINPWDVNEPDPGENGTRGTIPGPTIECDVGDTVFVHFRNRDERAGYDVFGRTHSLHVHGFVFEASSDGAFPLSPPDTAQPVGAEAPLWASITENGPHKLGDRVPPGATFTYQWQTVSWPTTAGMWLYHDHSINDTENMDLGAIGMVLIHNSNDIQDVDVRLPTAEDPTAPDPALMPGGSAAGSPIEERVTDLQSPIPVRAADLGGLGRTRRPGGRESELSTPPPLVRERTVELGGGILGELDPDLGRVERISAEQYRTPPEKLLILQLYHQVQGVGVCINGRQFLGNTPTVVAGPDSVMRFGLVGMGTMFHTFHLHGHRWIIPGPHGTTPTEQQFSPQDTPVSQFEDTRTFGPANSFVFTIDGRAGSFMRAGGRSPQQAVGEWHMHCHVLDHMMQGMMGSLLIINGGEVVTPLPVGRPMSHFNGAVGPVKSGEVHLTRDLTFTPTDIEVDVGQTVTWIWDDDSFHSVTSDVGASETWDSTILNGPPPPTFSRTFTAPGRSDYHCDVHPEMTGSVTVKNPTSSPAPMEPMEM